MGPRPSSRASSPVVLTRFACCPVNRPQGHAALTRLLQQRRSALVVLEVNRDLQLLGAVRRNRHDGDAAVVDGLGVDQDTPAVVRREPGDVLATVAALSLATGHRRTGPSLRAF